MIAYVARFSYRLRTPIRTNAGRVSIATAYTSGFLRHATVTAKPVDGLIRQFDAEATYEGDIQPMGRAGSTLEHGMTLVVKGSFNMVHPPLDVAPFLATVLYNLSGLTLQSHVFFPIDEMREFVSSVTWQMPTGETYPGMEVSWPWWGVMNLRDDDSRIATAADFAMLQQVMDGNDTVPLWRLILADAHRRRGTDLRDIVVRCATALDVGVAPLLSGKEKVDMRIFRGEVGATPDLRTSDPNLFQQISRLWYTRHGIVHHGRHKLFDDNPQRGASPLRNLELSDVDGFLTAVPRAIEFVQRNPP